jgi:hypothetical protein
MASIQKTQGITLYPLELLAANAVGISPAYDVPNTLAASIFVHVGRTDTSGDLTNGIEIRVEASAKSSGNDQWFPLAIFKTGRTVPESEVITVAASGTRNLTVASTTNLAKGDIIFVKHSTLELSEFHRVKATTPNATVHIVDPIANTQTSSTIYDQAEMFVAQLDLTAIGRIRLVADGSGGGRTFAVEAYMVTGDSIS